MGAHSVQSMIAACWQMKHLGDGLIRGALVADTSEAQIAAALCLTIAEQFSAVIRLVENRLSSHAPIIVRSMLEGLADLLILVDDPHYLNQLWYEKYKDDLAIGNALLADPQGHDVTTELAEIEAMVAEAKAMMIDLKSKGIRRQLTEEKFKRANLQHDYTSYRVFCGPSHNQILSLIGRHSGNGEILYHSDTSVSVMETTLGTAAGILDRALATLPKFTNLSDKTVGDVRNAIDAAHWHSGIGPES
jgi:hypothetical protein